MAPMLLNLLDAQPMLYVSIVVVMVASITLHELGHALAATWQGDPTPRMLGHLTWNPVVHMGWLSIGLVAVMGLGWGRTPVNPRHFRNRKWGDAMVSFAGPAVHTVLAVICAGSFVAAFRYATPPIELAYLLHQAIRLNLALFLLNMLPVPPLDGFSVWRRFFNMGRYENWIRGMGFWPIIVLLFVLSSPLGGVVFWGPVEVAGDRLLEAWGFVLP